MPDFESFDGTRIHYEDDGDGPPVVLLHGFAADGKLNWTEPGVVRALVDAGRRVIVPDARGHGRSDKPHDPAAYDDAAMVRDAVAVLDHLGLDEVDCGGYSMGALTTFALMPREPRVRRAVLGGIGGAALYWDHPGQRERRAAIAAALEATGEEANNPAVLGFRAFAERTGADLLALAAMQKIPPTPLPDPGSIGIPVLVLTSRDDELSGNPQKLADAIPGARLHWLSGTHLAAVADPTFAPTVVDFFARP